MNITLYSRIFRNVWAIDPAESAAYLPMIMNFITGQSDMILADDSDIDANSEPYCISAFETRRYSNYNDAPKGSVAVIPIQGIMDKDDWCGVYGTKSIARFIEQAEEHPNIIGRVLRTDSPGGNPMGTMQMADLIARTTKPNVGFVENGGYSAAYWALAPSDEIWLSAPIAGVGSIGTYSTIPDFTKFYEEKGVKIWEVYATESTEKNAAIRALINSQDPSKLRAEVDEINEMFLAFVREQRAGRIDESKIKVTNGMTARGQKAIDCGLADSIGTFADAVNRVAELAA